jgi:hypothetical protein
LDAGSTNRSLASFEAPHAVNTRSLPYRRSPHIVGYGGIEDNARPHSKLHWILFDAQRESTRRRCRDDARHRARAVIVGTASNGWEGQPVMFRWTQGSGLELQSSPLGQTYSPPTGISGDGSVIVGAAFGQRPLSGSGLDDTLAFRWTEAAGTKALELMPHPASPRSWNWPVLISTAGTTVIGFDSSWSDDAGLLRETTLVAWDEQGHPQPIRF